MLVVKTNISTILRRICYRDNELKILKVLVNFVSLSTALDLYSPRHPLVWGRLEFISENEKRKTKQR